MTAVDLGALGATNTNTRLTFEERVRALGLPIVPDKIVRRHMRAVIYGKNATWTGFLMVEIVAWASMYRLGELIVNRRNGYAFAFAIALGLVAASMVHPALLVLPIMAFVGYKAGFGWSDTKNLYAVEAPPHIRDRAEALARAGMKWFVAREGTDPLLFASKGWGPLRRDVCVGGWDTGNDDIDAA